MGALQIRVHITSAGQRDDDESSVRKPYRKAQPQSTQGQHHLVSIHEGSARWRCTICEQTWTSGNVRSVCPGVPTFSSWVMVPADRFVTWTELRRRHYTTSRAMPHAAVGVIKSPYYRYLYDLERSTSMVISPKREQAIAKAKVTSQAHYTCRMCATYYTSPDERKAFVAQVCKYCQWEVREWKQRVAWAREIAEQKAVLLQIETCRADQEQPGQPVNCTQLDLASGALIRTGALLPEDAPALAAWIDQRQNPVLTWDGGPLAIERLGAGGHGPACVVRADGAPGRAPDARAPGRAGRGLAGAPLSERLSSR